MPLYEFLCIHCDHKFEEVIRSDSSSLRCPFCMSNNIEKMLSVTNLKKNYMNFNSCSTPSSTTLNTMDCANASCSSNPFS